MDHPGRGMSMQTAGWMYNSIHLLNYSIHAVLKDPLGIQSNKGTNDKLILDFFCFVSSCKINSNKYISQVPTEKNRLKKNSHWCICKTVSLTEMLIK